MTKVEMLARELCLLYWTGMCHESGYPRNTTHTSSDQYVDSTWQSHMTEAARILAKLTQYEVF